ncbi:MAG: BrnT family toxin [Candidatus Aminicenantes bacterium]|nr:MAG: BrnT family toxin [Candidatus Aminicenantes bacterium]
MKKVRFEWDTEKDLANFRNHGVAFNEAKTVFYDENATEFYDEDHSLKEFRFLMIGLSSKLRILLVSYAVMEGKNEDIIRIISSRKATKNEQKIYFERLI